VCFNLFLKHRQAVHLCVREKRNEQATLGRFAKKNIEHMHGSMEPKNKIPSHNKKKKSWGHAPALGRVSTKFMHG
jgi:hypothetical protein